MNRLVWPRADCLAGVTMALINRFHNEQTSTAPVADVPEMCAAFATNAPTPLSASEPSAPSMVRGGRTNLP